MSLATSMGLHYLRKPLIWVLLGTYYLLLELRSSAGEATPPSGAGEKDATCPAMIPRYPRHYTVR